MIGSKYFFLLITLTYSIKEFCVSLMFFCKFQSSFPVVRVNENIYMNTKYIRCLANFQATCDFIFTEHCTKFFDFSFTYICWAWRITP